MTEPTATQVKAAELLGRVRMNAGQKAVAFLSSRMSYLLDGKPLTDVRRELKAVLEAAYPFLSVELAEDWTAGRKGSPEELSRKGGFRSDLFLVILVDSPGHQDDAGLGAIEAEVNEAVEDSWDKVLVFAHKNLGSKLERLPESYQTLVNNLTDYEGGKNVSVFSTPEDFWSSPKIDNAPTVENGFSTS